MTIKLTAIIALGLALAFATGAQAASSPYLPYTGHGGLDIVTDVESETTASADCEDTMRYVGNGQLETVESCDPVTTGSTEPGCSIYLPYTGHGGLDIVAGCKPIASEAASAI